MSLYNSPSQDESLEPSLDDKILQRINESYVQSLMKMMSSKVLKELRIENERLQKHLAAVTQDVHHLARDLQLLRGEDRSWHQETRLEAVSEELQQGALREKELVAELGQLKRSVEGRYEDLASHQRSLEKELRDTQRGLRTELGEVQRESMATNQELRSSVRDLRSDLEEQQEAMKLLQDTDFTKILGEAKQVLTDLQEERSWHKEALKQLRNGHEERRKQHQEASEELDSRVAHFEEALRNKMPKEIEKSEKNLLQHCDQLLAQVEKSRSQEAERLAQSLERYQQQTEGRVEECLDRARLMDQDVLDKINPELMLMKDQQQRFTHSLQEVLSHLPSCALGESQVHRECEIFRSDIGKLSEEFMRLSGSMDRVAPWLEWLHQHRPNLEVFASLEERLAALEGSQMQVLRGEQQRCGELRRQHELLEELQTQKRMLLAFEVQQRKRAPGEEKLQEEVEALKLRLKRFELTHIVEQKHLKICQEAAASCSQSRQMCEEIIGKLRQEMNGRSTDQQRFLKSCEERYAKWREDAVAWQQQQVQRMQDK